jgi:hypothetical protein
MQTCFRCALPVGRPCDRGSASRRDRRVVVRRSHRAPMISRGVSHRVRRLELLASRVARLSRSAQPRRRSTSRSRKSSRSSAGSSSRVECSGPDCSRNRSTCAPGRQSSQRWRGISGILTRRRTGTGDGQPDRLGEELPSRHIERPGLLYQLARNRDRHHGMTFPLELYPRTSTAEMAARCGANASVLDWRQRLACSKCGRREIDFVVTGTERR